jgi:nitroreductase
MTVSIDPDTVRAALELAVRAPSIHNSQPWRFRVGPTFIELHADPARQLEATDPDGRDLLISCGAALHHLRVALSALGRLPITTRLPDPDRPEHLATVEAMPRMSRHADLALAVSIPRRRSDRRAYGPRPVPDDRFDELTRRAAAEGVSLRVVGHTVARAHLVSVIAEADVLQRANPAYAYELARWTGTDGVPGTAAPPTGSYGDLSLRQFSTLRLRQPVESEPDGAGTLVILGTGADDRMARLRAGEAASAVLLAATRMGLATCPLTQPLEIPATRELIRTRVLNGELVPQLVLRIGWPLDRPGPFPATRRRPVTEVME